MCYLKVCLSSFAAGIIMALAGFELVAMDANNAFVAGAFIQGIGLLLVLYFDVELYNCHLCRAIKSEEKCKAIISIIISLLINIATIIAVAYLIRVAAYGTKGDLFIASANKFTDAREIAINGQPGKPWYMAIINGFMCGLLCYLGGAVFKRSNHAFAKIVAPILAVGIFVVCGFENLMTNVLYIAYAQRWTMGTFLNIVLVLIGNSLGAIFTFYMFQLLGETIFKKKTKKS